MKSFHNLLFLNDQNRSLRPSRGKWNDSSSNPVPFVACHIGHVQRLGELIRGGEVECVDGTRRQRLGVDLDQQELLMVRPRTDGDFSQSLLDLKMLTNLRIQYIPEGAGQ